MFEKFVENGPDISTFEMTNEGKYFHMFIYIQVYSKHLLIYYIFTHFCFG